MAPPRNIEGHLYPPFHPRWGGFAEELFHYSSRYFALAQSFLRNLSGDRDFDLSGFRAQEMHGRQRDIMARLLSLPPTAETALAVIALIRCIDTGMDETECPELASHLEALDIEVEPAHHHGRPRPAGSIATASPDPFLHLAERLGMPVRVHEQHVEIDLHLLGEHLDSPDATLRSNLQAAIVQLHDAGFVIRHHPHLTHAEARQPENSD